MADVTDGSLDCPKCGKPYQRAGMRRDKHIKECKGVPFVPTGSNGRVRRNGQHRPESQVEILLKEAEQKKEMISTQRDVLNEQIDEQDRIIEALKKAKLEQDKSLLTSHCLSCNTHIDETKKAQWDKYEVETAYHNIVNYNSQILLYLKRKGIKLPEQPDLDKEVPMDHRKQLEPARPKGVDPRPESVR